MRSVIIRVTGEYLFLGRAFAIVSKHAVKDACSASGDRAPGLVRSNESWNTACRSPVACPGQADISVIQPHTGIGQPDTDVGYCETLWRCHESGVWLGASDRRKDGCALGW